MKYERVAIVTRDYMVWQMKDDRLFHQQKSNEQKTKHEINQQI